MCDVIRSREVSFGVSECRIIMKKKERKNLDKLQYLELNVVNEQNRMISEEKKFFFSNNNLAFKLVIYDFAKRQKFRLREEKRRVKKLRIKLF